MCLFSEKSGTLLFNVCYNHTDELVVIQMKRLSHSLHDYTVMSGDKVDIVDRGYRFHATAHACMKE